MLHPFALFALAVPVIVGMRFVVDRLDRQRIRDDVATRGGHVDDITWRHFGRGWFGEKSDRVYEVAWTDAEGRTRSSWCKTSMFTGVFWSEDQPPEGGRSTAALEAENRRLREELERVRRGQA